MTNPDKRQDNWGAQFNCKFNSQEKNVHRGWMHDGWVELIELLNPVVLI